MLSWRNTTVPSGLRISLVAERNSTPWYGDDPSIVKKRRMRMISLPRERVSCVAAGPGRECLSPESAKRAKLHRGAFSHVQILCRGKRQTQSMDTLFGGVQAGNSKCATVHRIWWWRKSLKYRESSSRGAKRAKIFP